MNDRKPVFVARAESGVKPFSPVRFVFAEHLLEAAVAAAAL